MKAVKLHNRVLHIADDELRAQNWIDKSTCKDGFIYTFYRGSSMPVSPGELNIVDYDDSRCHKCDLPANKGICATCLHEHAEHEIWEYSEITRETRFMK